MKTRARTSAVAFAMLLTLNMVWPASAPAAILTVTSCADTGPTTLRGLVAAASAGDTILLPACTITLATPVTITTSLTLSGEGPTRTIVSGGGVTQVLRVSSGTVTIFSGVTIRGGMAGPVAGVENSGTLTLLNTTVTGNTGTGGGYGAVVNNASGILTLLNSTVSGNTARSGSGIENAGSVTLLNSTVSGNSAGSGGGLSNLLGTVVAKNTIIADNTGGNCTGAISSQGHNLDSDGSCGFAGPGDLSGVDPKLGPLGNNGGPTQTQALLPGSPAIDAGDNVGCPPTDQRGVTRPQDGRGTGTPVCDIGAYEVPFVPPPNPLTISPPSGRYVGTQGFDLVLEVSPLSQSIIGGQVTVDRLDVTAALARCVVPGTLVGGFTARCPNLRAALFGPGSHTVSVTLNLSDGTSLSDSVVWEVDANTEP